MSQHPHDDDIDPEGWSVAAALREEHEHVRDMLIRTAERIDFARLDDDVQAWLNKQRRPKP